MMMLYIGNHIMKGLEAYETLTILTFNTTK